MHDTMMENRLFTIEQTIYIINMLSGNYYFISCHFRIEQSPYDGLYYVVVYDKHNNRVGRL